MNDIDENIEAIPSDPGYVIELFQNEVEETLQNTGENTNDGIIRSSSEESEPILSLLMIKDIANVPAKMPDVFLPTNP